MVPALRVDHERTEAVRQATLVALSLPISSLPGSTPAIVDSAAVKSGRGRRLLATLASGFDNLAIRIGIASLFIVNGMSAFVEPESFQAVLADNLIGGRLSDDVRMWLVWIAGVNDLVLGAAVLFFARRRPAIYLWAALWFGVIAVIKAMNMTM